MVIFRWSVCLNLNWIKSYDIILNKTFLFSTETRNYKIRRSQEHGVNHKCFWQLCFSILEEKTANLSFKIGYFLTIFGHFFASYINIFYKTDVQTVILRCLVCLNLDWIKNYDILSVKIFIFSCLKMHHFRGKIPK